MAFDRRRREFITQSACVGLGFLGLAAGENSPSAPARPSPHPNSALQQEMGGNSRIVIAQDDRVRTTQGTIDPVVLSRMVGQAIHVFTGSVSPEEAWSRFVSPGDVVGIKVSCLAGKGLSTHPELAMAIVEGIRSAGVEEDRIIIWDRLTGDLRRAGFETRTDGRGVRCYGTDSPGAGYEAEPTVHGSVGSRLSRILTRQCTAILNAPVLKDHSLAGISVSLKNHFGAIDNPNKYHLDGCNPYVADLYAIEEIASRNRLIICDALTAQYEGGPPYMPQWSWDFNGIIVGTDPVALDQIAYGIIDRKRTEKGLKVLAKAGKEPKYIATAADASHRLGTNDPQRIDVIYL